MNISSATFHCSAPDLDSCPDESLPEFAFIGRSNVGKSSLLNLLAGKRGLARVSPTPGFTKLINIFTMSKTWRLVDLPGYGFAKVARKDSSQFNQAVLDYLQNRPNLHCVFALIDSGLPPQDMDLNFVEWLADNEIPFVLVFTKTDQVKPAEVQKNIETFKKHISEWCETLPVIMTCSAASKHGRGDLLDIIKEVLSTAQAEPVEQPEQNKIEETVETEQTSPETVTSAENFLSIRQGSVARDIRGKRPKLPRPW
jgi:GTP-binding protein